MKDLALTKDATDVEYKALVEHVAFKSKSNVKSVCAELAANLKAQGWTNDGMDLVQPKSSILKRKRGKATLTIFVKPENGGSEVRYSPRAFPGTDSKATASSVVGRPSMGEARRKTANAEPSTPNIEITQRKRATMIRSTINRVRPCVCLWQELALNLPTLADLDAQSLYRWPQL